MILRLTLLIFTVIFLCCTLYSCFDAERGLYDLGLETNLKTSLPEGGNVLYRIFAPMGKDAMEYAAIQYAEDLLISEHFVWKTMDDLSWKEINRLIDCIDLYISLNEEKEPIPSNYLPTQDMQYAMVGNFPSLASPYAFFVYDPINIRVYVLINLTQYIDQDKNCSRSLKQLENIYGERDFGILPPFVKTPSSV